MDNIKAIISNIKNSLKELKGSKYPESLTKEILTMFSFFALISTPLIISVITKFWWLDWIYPVIALWWLYFLIKKDE